MKTIYCDEPLPLDPTTLEGLALLLTPPEPEVQPPQPPAPGPWIGWDEDVEVF